ncbi:hypothetical protein [Oceanispirochaeta sp. M1]|uniref:hypothetical protein n=2 Tax=unclassified Oceanispirochaeta TaxID=2635722 RepID=UPI0011C0547F|nr:hypothetical protein [Oceanispirochaeta sp. M1]NPD72145.1 hypothetical protein [Oceanispirochaeta sp. M1]
MQKRFILAIISIVFCISGCVDLKKDDSAQHYERAILKLHRANTEQERFYALNDAAKESYISENYDEAQEYAEELQFLSEKYLEDWNYGNAIQDYHIVLGKIILKDGNVSCAKEHLLSAGMSPGSPQMNSFGPNMSLAKELLRHGETEVVLEYFNLCRNFWELHDGKLDKWIKTVKNGDLPDFGSNLIY